MDTRLESSKEFQLVLPKEYLIEFNMTIPSATLKANHMEFHKEFHESFTQSTF